VYSYTTMFTEAGVYAVYAGTTPAKADEVLSLIRRELASLATAGLAAEEFERARGHMKGSLVLSLEDPGGRMSRLGKSEISHGEVLTVDQILKRLDHVTIDDANRAATRVLTQPLALTVLGPFGARAFADDGVEIAAHHGARR
jgi:predicted Zn-dependent peptidase